MEELGYGPNGGLVYCMECVAAALVSTVWRSVLTEADGDRYLVQNLDWLQDLLGEYSDDDYFIFDCPGASLARAACTTSCSSHLRLPGGHTGQIELYSHLPVMKQLCDALRDWGFAICGVYLIDSLFIVDPTKFISGVLCSLSAMVQLELPHINVLTKCDLVDEKELSKCGHRALLGPVCAGLERSHAACCHVLTRYLDPSSGYLLENLATSTDPKWRPLSTAICNVVRCSAAHFTSTLAAPSIACV